MPPPTSCPSCQTPLALFTPREAESHVNACLDAQGVVISGDEKPTCAVCDRDLSSLTSAAREEHANRCADTLLPLPPVEGRPARRRGRRGGGIASANRNAQPPANDNTRQVEPLPEVPTEPKGDLRVEHLLKMLGLERFATRFAREEIDLVALRLLSDDDLAALSIPEAARRRLAEAMHSVPILAKLQRIAQFVKTTSSQDPDSEIVSRKPSEIQTAEDDVTLHGAPTSSGERKPLPDLVSEVVPPPPTQRFVESRLGARMSHRNDTVLDEVSDEEYAPTPIMPPILPDVTPRSQRHDDPLQQQNGGMAIFEDNNQLPEKDGSNDAAPGMPAVSLAEHGEDSSSSELVENVHSFSSDLADVKDVALMTSQISVDIMLRKWRRRLIDREHARHKREMARIEEKYKCALKQIFGRLSPTTNLQVDAPASPVDDSIIDLTQDPACETFPRRGTAHVTLDDTLRSSTRPDTVLVSGSINAQLPQVGSDNGSKHDDASSEEKSRRSPAPAPAASSQVQSSPASPPPAPAVSSPVPSLPSPVSPLPVLAESPPVQSPSSPVSSPAPVVSSPSRSPPLSAPSSLPPVMTAVPQPALSQSSSSLSAVDFTLNKSQANKPIVGKLQDSDDDFEECPKWDPEQVQQSQCLHDESGAGGSQRMESDDDILDLIGVDQENEFGPAMEEELEEERNQSRLKKKRKVSNPKDEDIIRAISSDEVLHQDILMMECIGFSRILQSIRSQNVHVSKKSLHDFLVRQGVLFKSDAPVGQQSKRFLNRLNTDNRDPSE